MARDYLDLVEAREYGDEPKQTITATTEDEYKMMLFQRYRAEEILKLRDLPGWNHLCLIAAEQATQATKEEVAYQGVDGEKIVTLRLQRIVATSIARWLAQQLSEAKIVADLEPVKP